MTSSFQQPFQTVNDLDGSPLTGGYIYFGQANTDPTVLANQIAIFYDAACTVAAPNPVRTSGGFLLNGTAPANIYVAGTTDFSVAVHNSNNTARYTIAAYPVRFNASAITFDTVIVGTSIVPDAAGGAFDGTTALPWSSMVARAMQARTLNLYSQTQPAVAADLGRLTQLCLPVLGCLVQAAGPVLTNILNAASVSRTGAGVFEVNMTVAMPSTVYLPLATVTSNDPNNSITATATSASKVTVRTFLGAVATDCNFSLVCFGNPAVTDPIA
jgi:hypothetical protein